MTACFPEIWNAFEMALSFKCVSKILEDLFNLILIIELP